MHLNQLLLKAVNLFFVSWIFIEFAYGEIFTSLASLEQLLLAERQMVDMLKTFINTDPNESQLPKILEELNRLKDIVDLDDPIDAFQHIKTAFRVMQDLKDNNQEAYKAVRLLHLPTFEDVDGAAVALLRLQDTYRISVEDLGTNLSADDCFMLGYVAMKQENFYHMINWLRLTERKLKQKNFHAGYKPMFNETILYDYLAYAFREQKNFEWALWYTRKMKDLEPTFVNVDNVKWYEDELEYDNSDWDGTEKNLPQIRNPRPLKDVYLEYEALCRGERQKMTEYLRKDLFCFYKCDLPFLKLARIKVEVVHRDPEIYLFKDVISDSEIDAILGMAKPRLRRAMVVNPDADEPLDYSSSNMVASFRVAKNMWIEDGDHEVISRISKRVKDMTGLSGEYAENIQVANYGLGGHYEPHYDMITDERMKNETHGNRIATVLFYLSEPKLGGATVFDDLGITLFPIKNDAVFWFNVNKDGQPLWKTRHAGCPVLYGRKWVANKGHFKNRFN